MEWIINNIQRKHRLQITIVILIIVVVSIWIPYNSAAKEYMHDITKKALRALTSVKSSVLLRSNFESHNESPHKSERDVYEMPTAAGYSSADVSAGIVSQNDTTSNQPGLTVDTYPVGVAVNPITKKIYTTNELSNSLSVISSTSNNVEGTISLGIFHMGLLLILLIVECMLQTEVLIRYLLLMVLQILNCII
jgi:YVTN family beta-propeller protein